MFKRSFRFWLSTELHECIQGQGITTLAFLGEVNPSGQGCSPKKSPAGIGGVIVLA